MSDASGPVLEARGLTRTLGEAVKQTILHGLDLQVAAGEFLALTGPSGSGKSTLLYLLGALDRPTAGEVLLDGQALSPLGDDERSALRNQKLGFVFQFHFLLPEFSAAENVMIPLLRRGESPAVARKKALSALNHLGLGELTGRRPGQLSGGQQQRVSIARALAGEPRVLLADEPTGNLDVGTSGLVFDELLHVVRGQGVAALIATHNPELAARMDRRVTLRDGRVVEV